LIFAGLGCFDEWQRIWAVADVAKEAGLSRRRFCQVFDEQIGMTRKHHEL
jgi:AraC-like DNA-binding protein